MLRPVVCLTFCLLASCSSQPPKPPGVSGDYRPINRPEARIQAPAIPQVFDFIFEGDIQDALVALRALQPQVTVMPPIGRAVPLKVRINLRETNLETALRAIGDQGGRTADVVWYAPAELIENRVFVRFRTPEHKSANPPAPR